MWNAEEIRRIQHQYSEVGRQVENITNKIYEHVKHNPESTYMDLPYSLDKEVIVELVKLGYTVDEGFIGIYKDTSATRIKW